MLTDDKGSSHPVGTGPYRLKSFRRTYRVEYERNPKWAETGRVERYPSEGEAGDREAGLLEDAGRPLPIVDRIIEYVIDDDSTQWLKFVTGDMESSGISRDNWNAVISQDGLLTGSLGKKGIRLYTRPTLDVFYIGFNMDDPVVGGNPKAAGPDASVDKRRKLRQALTCAFNSERWIQYWNRRVVRAKGPIPPGVAGTLEGDSPYPFDLKKAKALLVEAGYPNGIDPATGRNLQLAVEMGGADPQIREAVELVETFMREIGVVFKPSYNNWPTFLGKMERRQSQMFWLGWVADYPDAENFLYPLFHSANLGGGGNRSFFVSAHIDSLIEESQRTLDARRRTTRTTAPRRRHRPPRPDPAAPA
jgi:oligopeptide transport system substrate-binding protein